MISKWIWHLHLQRLCKVVVLQPCWLLACKSPLISVVVPVLRSLQYQYTPSCMPYPLQQNVSLLVTAPFLSHPLFLLMTSWWLILSHRLQLMSMSLLLMTYPLSHPLLQLVIGVHTPHLQCRYVVAIFSVLYLLVGCWKLSFFWLSENSWSARMHLTYIIS